MTVFITIPWFLPAFKAGGPIRSIANLVDRFDEGIEYRVFCGDTDLDGSELTDIEKGKWVPFNKNTQVWYAEKGEVSKTLTDQVELLKPDVLFIIGIYTWHYNIVPLLFCKAPKKILSVRGMLHPGALTQKKVKKRLYLDMLRISGIGKKIIFHATDEEEAKFIRYEFGKKAAINIAANYGKQIVPGAQLYKTPGSLKMVTVALISPMKNYLTVLEALALCTADISYEIYGPVKEPEYWQQCLEQIKKLPANIKVNYRGQTDPENISSILEQNHLFIMPSKSENFGHAIYEALSAGKPVITSRFTPWNSLQEAHAGMNTETSAGSIAEAIAFFAAADNDAYRFFVQGAINYIAQKISIEKTDEQYRRLFFDQDDV